MSSESTPVIMLCVLKLKEKGTGIALKVGSQASEFWIHFHHKEEKKKPKTSKKPQSADLQKCP